MQISIEVERDQKGRGMTFWFIGLPEYTWQFFSHALNKTWGQMSQEPVDCEWLYSGETLGLSIESPKHRRRTEQAIRRTLHQRLHWETLWYVVDPAESVATDSHEGQDDVFWAREGVDEWFQPESWESIAADLNYINRKFAAALADYRESLLPL